MLRIYYVNNLITSTDNQVIDFVDSYLIFTEGDSERSYLVVFTPEEGFNNYGYLLKFSFSDSLPIKKIENKKLSQRLEVEAVVEGISIKISSDEDSSENTDDVYSGILFFSNESLLNLSLPDEVEKKYYVFPSTISPGQDVNILLRIRLKDFKSLSYFSTLSKDSFSVTTDLLEYLLSYSKLYYNLLSRDPSYITKIGLLGINDVRPFPIFEKSFFSDNGYISAESYFYSLFPINALKVKNIGYFENSVDRDRSEQFYAYSIQGNSQYAYPMFYVSSSSGSIFTTIIGNMNIFDYVKQLLHMLSLEMTFPIGVVSSNRNANLQNLFISFRNLFSFAISRNGSLPQTLSSSGPSSSNTSLYVGKTLVQLLISYAKIFEGYIRKNYSSLTTNSDFVAMVNNMNALIELANYQNFWDISAQELEDKIYDLVSLYSLPIYLYTFFSMRNLLPNNQSDYWKIWATLFYRLLVSHGNLLLKELSTFPVNQYSTENTSLTDEQKNKIISLMLIQSLHSMAFSNYLNSLPVNFLDFSVCQRNCDQVYLSRREFKKVLIPSDLVQNLFNVVLEKSSCRFGDSILAISSGTCADFESAVKNTYVDLFNKRLFCASVHNIAFPNQIEIKVSAEMF